MSQSSVNEQVVRDLYSASARADVHAIIAAHHPKAVWELPHSAPYGGVLAAHAPLGEYIAALYVQLGGGLESELDEVEASGDRVLVQGWFVVESDRIRFGDLWQLRDGLVIRRTLALDSAAAFVRLSGLAA